MEKRYKKGKKVIWLKIDLPAILAFALLAGLIFIYLIPGFEKVMMERKRVMLKEVSYTAFSILNHFYSLETDSTLNKDEAKKMAREAVGSIRYGADRKDYFWITDLRPVMIEHPYRSDLRGKDLNGFRDSNGKEVFVEFVKSVSVKGESFVDYMWQWNDDSTKNVPKLSYVRLFEPWGWIIGTGIYVEDVKTEIRKIENRAVIISGLIAAVIIVLLSIIARQSHRIEIKRRKAEEELLRSRELYRTLAEASTEAAIIWSSEGIQANKTLLNRTGFSEDTVSQVGISGIISSDEIEFSDPQLMFDDLRDTIHAECRLRVNNGADLKVLCDFSAIMLDRKKAVMIVIRPVIETEDTVLMRGSSPVVNTLSAGLFSIRIGKRSHFVFVSEPLAKHLGYENSEHLITLNPSVLFEDQGEFSFMLSQLLGGKNIHNMAVTLRDKNSNTFYAILNVCHAGAGPGDPVFSGTVEPVTWLAINPLLYSDTAGSYFASSLLDAPLSVLKGAEASEETYKAAEKVKRDSTVREALKQLRNSSKILRLEGIETGDMTVITEKAVTDFLISPAWVLTATACKKLQISELREAYRIMQVSAAAMIQGGSDPVIVTEFISLFSDLVSQRVIELSLSEAGEPPVKFAFIQTGSAGRNEQSLFTDQDNGIIFENCSGTTFNEARNYFISLGEKINHYLAETGYNLCRGNNMAGNPKWCMQLSDWESVFAGWIRNPEPGNILDISIFFDFRHCFGEEGLTTGLRTFVNKNLIASDIFFHHMAAAISAFEIPTNILKAGSTDIKKILMPLTAVSRLYSLRNSAESLSTRGRLVSLCKKGIITNEQMREAVNALKTLSAIRLRHQSGLIIAGSEADNTVDFGKTDSYTVYLAAKAVDAVNSLLLKMKTDFFVTTI